MRQEVECFKCSSLECSIVRPSHLREEDLCLCGLICDDCGHVACCPRCGTWEDDDGVIDHEDYCIDK